MNEYDWKMRDQEIRFYYDNDKCPHCFSENIEIDSSESNERDSSNDIHRCKQCGWYCNEMSLWPLRNKL